METKIDNQKTAVKRGQLQKLLQDCCLIFNHNLRHYRIKAGLTQRELAYYTGTNQPHVAHWERDDTINLELNTLVKIAHILDISVSELLTPIPEIDYIPHEKQKRDLDD